MKQCPDCVHGEVCKHAATLNEAIIDITCLIAEKYSGLALSIDCNMFKHKLEGNMLKDYERRDRA